jgi:hypothetical protein
VTAYVAFVAGFAVGGLWMLWLALRNPPWRRGHKAAERGAQAVPEHDSATPTKSDGGAG